MFIPSVSKKVQEFFKEEFKVKTPQNEPVQEKSDSIKARKRVHIKKQIQDYSERQKIYDI